MLFIKPIKYKYSNGVVYVRSGKNQEWKKVYTFNVPSPDYAPINQFFGENKASFYKDWGMKGHNGIDWFAPANSSLYSPIDGKIASVDKEDKNGYGKSLTIINEKEDGTATFIVEGHLNDIFVEAGQMVKAGDLIGLTGNTGKWTTGAHLHEGKIDLEPMRTGLTKHWITKYGYAYSKDYLGYTDHLSLIDNYKVMSSDKYEKKIVQRVDTLNGAKGQCYWVENGDWKFLDSEKNPISRHIPLVDKVLLMLKDGIKPDSYYAITEKEFEPFKDNII